jgi:hypothetical protein
MILQETPSGCNLRLFSPEKPEAAVVLSRADIRVFAEVFKLLDEWAREDAAAAIERGS